MATIKTKSVKPTAEKKQIQYIGGLTFNKDNYRWMIIGAVVIIIGMLLMSGGENMNPNVFDTSLVYSPRRITVAPIVILIGFIVEIYAILKKPTKTENTAVPEQR